jgi:hypothetical protein
VPRLLGAFHQPAVSVWRPLVGCGSDMLSFLLWIHVSSARLIFEIAEEVDERKRRREEEKKRGREEERRKGVELSFERPLPQICR